jgi:hypothetical protein
MAFANEVLHENKISSKKQILDGKPWLTRKSMNNESFCGERIPRPKNQSGD